MDTNLADSTVVQDIQALELQLEQEAITDGISRYEKRRVDITFIDPGTGKERVRKKATNEGDLLPAQLMAAKFLTPFNAAVDSWLAGVRINTGGRHASVARYIDTCRQEQPNLLAVATIRHVIGQAGVRRQKGKAIAMVASALSLSRVVEESLFYPKFKRENPGYARKLEAELSRGGDDERRVALLRTAGKVTQMKPVPWDRAKCLHLGTLLLTLLAESTVMITLDLVSTKPSRGTPRQRYEVNLSPAFAEWLDKAHQRGQLLYPLHVPMVVPPVKWSAQKVRGGGYLHGNLRLIVNTSENKAKAAVAGWSDAAWDAFNALQETPWEIHSEVLQVMEQVWEAGGNLAKVPSRTDAPLPYWPEGTVERDSAEWKQRVAEVYRVRRLNSESIGARVTFGVTLSLARRFADMRMLTEAGPAPIPFYFPHVMDFRGRCYPSSVHLSPQGDKVQRALLVFHRKKPLGDEGAFWLAVHLANCYGIDKVSFEERVQWAEQNTASILRTAEDPLGASRDWWTAADTPWLFLAACYEWRRLVQWTQAGNRQEDFLSNLPVGMDGTCNGMQQFSALVLDEHTGALLGMVPSDQPADIYAKVASEANKIIEQDAAAGNPVAQRWLKVGGMTRKLAKRNTMTTPYSVTEYGMRGQQAGVLKEMVKAGEVDWEADLEDAAYLAGVNARVIPAVITSAAAVMGFLKSCAAVMSKAKLPVQWSTPVGFQVTQRYPKTSSKSHRVQILGKSYQLMLKHKDELAVDSRAQELGISPNYVHSLDASHMLATTAYCREDGIEDFQMIHDSFGTHAGSVGLMNANLRKAFVDMYAEGNLLEQFKQAQAAVLQAAGKGDLVGELPEVPQQGSLDIAAIERSDYFFA